MAWLDFLKNGNELSELLIEGNNPYGAQLLKQADVDQMRNHIQPDERVLGYVLAQLAGAALGAWLAHAMFGLDIVQWSTKVRSGAGQWLAEAVATAGLLLVILRSPAGKASGLVACYIGAAYWFTASTSFANPAAVMGRMFSDTFAGIAPASALGFVLAQTLGALLGVGLANALSPTKTSV